MLIRSYRTWYIHYSGGGFFLSSWAEPVWTSPDMVAICSTRLHHFQTYPEKADHFERLHEITKEHLRRIKCTCGIHSVKDISGLISIIEPFKPDDDLDWVTTSVSVIAGSIINYGVVLEAEDGYRASNVIVDGIFKCITPCFCGGPADFIVTTDRPSRFFHICYKHPTPGDKKWGEKYRIEDFFKQLSERYDCPVISPPREISFLR